MRDLNQYQFTLFDTNPLLINAWQRHFAGVGNVTVRNQPLQELTPHDVLVSPANSFGVMDGGIDQAIAHTIGGIEQRVQKQLSIEWEGQQPVGTCTLVKTETEKFRFLAVTPTMRTPRNIDPSAVYDAFRAVILAVTNNQNLGIRLIACPGLGTGTGKVDPNDAAAYMRFAYDSFSHDVKHNWNDINSYLTRFSRGI